jgi:hypothetical protein
MIMRRAAQNLFLSILFAMGFPMAHPAVADGWVSPWSGTQSLVANGHTARAGFSTDGSFFIGEADGAVTRLSKLDGAGQLMWSRQVDVFDSYELTGLFPGDSGDVVYFTAYRFLGRIDSAGNSSWLHPQLPVNSFVVADEQSVFRTTCTAAGLLVAEKLHRTTGVSAWQTVAYSGPSCLYSHAISDAAGNLYIDFSDSTKAHLLKLDAGGRIVWNQTTASNGRRSLIAPSGADILYVYAYGQQGISALNAADGSTLWTYPTPNAPTQWLALGADLVFSDNIRLVRLDSTSGHEVWALQDSGRLVPHVEGNRLVLVANYDAFLTTVNASSGVEGAPQALDVDKGYTLAADYLDGGTLGILATQKATNNLFGKAPARLYRQNIVDGTNLPPITLPEQPLSIIGTNVADPSGDVIGVGYSAAAPGNVHVRRVRAADGSEAWHVNPPTADPGLAVAHFGAAPVGDAVIVSVTENFTGYADNAAGEIMSFDRITGARRWSTPLTPSPGGQIYVNASDPVDDGAGNPVVAVYSQVYAGPYSFNPIRSIIKLDKADGHVLWRHDVPAGSHNWFDAISLVKAGGYLVTGGEFDATPDETRIAGLSLQDGSTQWHSPPFPSAVFEIHPVDANHVDVSFDGGVAKLDVTDGLQDWVESSNSTSCVPYCQGYAVAVLTDGSLVSGGEIWGSHLPYLAVFDGNVSTPAFEALDVADAGRRGTVTFAFAEPSGGATLRLNRYMSYLGMYSYATLDPTTKHLAGTQVTSERLYDPGARGFGGIPIRRVDTDHVLADAFMAGGSQAAGSVAALVNTQVLADGDLSVTVSGKASASPSHPFHFDAQVHYTGTAPIDGVTLSLGLPSNTGAIVLQCAGSGQNHCVLDTSGAAARAHFSMAPGDTLDLSGQFVPTPCDESPPATISAVVFGPIGLRETDTTNNLNRAALTVGMFADGFDLP